MLRFYCVRSSNVINVCFVYFYEEIESSEYGKSNIEGIEGWCGITLIFKRVFRMF